MTFSTFVKFILRVLITITFMFYFWMKNLIKCGRGRSCVWVLTYLLRKLVTNFNSIVTANWHMFLSLCFTCNVILNSVKHFRPLLCLFEVKFGFYFINSIIESCGRTVWTVWIYRNMEESWAQDTKAAYLARTSKMVWVNKTLLVHLKRVITYLGL